MRPLGWAVMATRYVEPPVVTCSECLANYSVTEARELAVEEEVAREDGTKKGVRLTCAHCGSSIFYLGSPLEDEPELVEQEAYARSWPDSPRLHQWVELRTLTDSGKMAMAVAFFVVVIAVLPVLGAKLGWW